MRENQLLSDQRPVKQGARRKHDGTITPKLTINVKNWKPINKNSKVIVTRKWCPKVMKMAWKTLFSYRKHKKRRKTYRIWNKKNAFSTQKPLLENDFSTQNLNTFFWIPIKKRRGIAKTNVNTGLNRNYAIATQRLSLICYLQAQALHRLKMCWLKIKCKWKNKLKTIYWI